MTLQQVLRPNTHAAYDATTGVETNHAQNISNLMSC